MYWGMLVWMLLCLFIFIQIKHHGKQITAKQNMKVVTI